MPQTTEGPSLRACNARARQAIKSKAPLNRTDGTERCTGGPLPGCRSAATQACKTTLVAVDVPRQAITQNWSKSAPPHAGNANCPTTMSGAPEGSVKQARERRSGSAPPEPESPRRDIKQRVPSSAEETTKGTTPHHAQGNGGDKQPQTLSGKSYSLQSSIVSRLAHRSAPSSIASRPASYSSRLSSASRPVGERLQNSSPISEGGTSRARGLHTTIMHQSISPNGSNSRATGPDGTAPKSVQKLADYSAPPVYSKHHDQSGMRSIGARVGARMLGRAQSSCALPRSALDSGHSAAQPGIDRSCPR